MKKYFFTSLIALVLMASACSEGQSQSANLNANAFSDKIKQTPDANVVDVRTPEEYAKGHLADARNIDWRNANFSNQITLLDKSKPVFVYCLSGGRSASAAAKMREMGFKQVYELDGGIMKWRAASLPEVSATNGGSAGMSKQQFEQLITSDKLVLVDFYAEWCAPCKKMEPYLKEIATDMKDKVKVVRINVDDNPDLCQVLGVRSLPILHIYKDKKLSWSYVGFIEKEEVVKQLK